MTIDEAYIVWSAAFHFAERRPRIEASGDTVEQASLPLSHWVMISPEPSSVPALSRGKLIVTFSLPRIFWKPATMAGSATSAFLSDAQHMLIVTGFSVATRAVVRAAIHQVLRVFFSVSSQVSWARAGVETAPKQIATRAQANILVILMIGPPVLRLRPNAVSPPYDSRVTVLTPRRHSVFCHQLSARTKNRVDPL